jgi:DNA processing protein
MRRRPPAADVLPGEPPIDSLRLARTDGVGPLTYRRLLARYGGAAAAIAALPGLARDAGRTAAPSIPSPEEVAREQERLARLGGRFLVLGQPGYPPLLALLADAPPVLACLGEPARLAGPAVALVGGRNASANGARVAEALAADLAGAGLVVVSGLARGIDAAAHTGALATGRTVAAVAGGLDCPYPPEHADLQRRIAETGVVLAEAPLGTAPQARHFPRRNRVIAGLALGVIVVEAALRSGSLITARLAQDAGREIFAVPGSPLDPRARGSNDLIRQGAHLTETAADVLENLPDHPLRQGLARAPLFARADDPTEPLPHGCGDPVETDDLPPDVVAEARTSVVRLLGPAPTAVDDLLRRCQLSPAAVLAALLELELAGRIETLPGQRVALLA